MSDVEDDLQTTSEVILADTDKLASLEEAKRNLDAGDEERVSLSVEIAQIGRRIERATAAESELAHQEAER
jgi:hypothetical protein